MTSARVVWALATAEPLGLLTDAAVLDKAATWLTQEFAKVDGGDHETRATILHALSTREQGDLRAGQRPEPGPPGPVRRRARLPGADLRQPRPRVAGRRGPRRPRPARQDRADRPRRQGPALLVGRGAAPLAPLRRRDHRAGRPGLRPGPAAVARARGGRRLAAGPPPGHRLAAAQGQGAGAGRAGGVLRQGPGAPRTATAWSSPSTTTRSTGPTSPARPRARRSASRAGSSRRRQEPRPVRHRGPRQVRLRRDPDRLHPRLRPRPGPREQAVRHPPPRLLARHPELDGKPLAAGFGVGDQPAGLREHRHPDARSAARCRSPSRPGATSPRASRRGSATSSSWRNTSPPARRWSRARSARQASHYTVDDGVLTFYFTPDQHPSVVYEVYGYLPGAVPRPAAEPLQRLRAGPPPPGRARRLQGPRPRREVAPTPTGPRPTSCTPAARPSSTPAGSPRPRRS